MHRIALANGETVPALGQGTWKMGERPALRAAEIAALREGITLGLTLIDTAEMYGDGATEALVAEAMNGLRDQVFLVSKAYPHNASRARLPQACDRSLKRLKTDRIDLYLLHWRGDTPLGETVEAMETLRASGKIRHWGVSNFDSGDMEDLMNAGGKGCTTDQILYNLTRRGPETGVMPFLATQNIPVMAYSPVEQGRLIAHPALAEMAKRLNVTQAQIAIAWTLARKTVISIPKAGSVDHVRENRRAADLILSADDLQALERAFPKPSKKQSLEML